MNAVAGMLQLAGIILGIPAFLFVVGTGDSRLLRFKPGFEQKLIDRSTLIIVASIVGDLAFLSGLAIEGRWLPFALFALMDVAGTAALFSAARHAQWELDYRMADVAGMFWCRDCVEVHHLAAGCYADDDSEATHG